MRLLRFQGPRPKLPDGLSKPKALLSRFKAAKARKDQAEPVLRDAYRYALPQRERFNEHYTELQKRNNHIFDSTAVLEVPRFATRVQMNITPPFREYCRLDAGPDIPKEIRERPEVKIGLADATDTMFSYFNSSNIFTQEHEAFMDLSISTGAINFWQGDFGAHPFRFDAVPMHELVLEEGPQSTIESTWRDTKICVGHIERLYPGARLTAQHQKLMRENKADVKVPLIEGVLYDPDTDRFFGVLLDNDKQPTIMWETFWRTSPRQVFRWSVVTGEIYGRGPVLMVLPDIKTANKVVEFILRNAALQVSGVYTSTADTAMNPYTMRIAPGIVMPVQSNDSRNPTIRALERSGDIGLGFEVLKQLQDNIRMALLATPGFLQNLEEGPVQSATAWNIADKRAIAETGGAYGRLQTELIEKRVGRAVQILGEQGRIPPIRVDGRNITLKYQSPLSRAQDQDELIDLEAGMDMVNRVAPGALPLGIKIEDLAAFVAEKTGVDPRLVRSEEERQQRMQQAAQMITENREALPAAA